MPGLSNVTFAFALIGSLLLTSPARAEPARAALIMGNATYNTLPGIPGCAKSANTVAAAAHALGFQVTARQDASTGGIDAGIAEFADHLAGGGTGFVYICGYATDFNDRTFVLPTSARIERPSDVLTQGVLAKAMLGPMSRDAATVGVVVFDLIAKPDGPVRLGLDALAALPVPDGVGIVAATEATQGDRPTPLATALVDALAGPRVTTQELLTSVRTFLGGNPAIVAAIHMPAHTGILAGPQPAAPPPPPVAVAPPAPPVLPPTSPVTMAQPPVPVVTAPSERVPDETQMTDPDRRKVQGVLLRLGYYAAAVDGVFGPETRAAIRRYQHEIGSEMTGRLTADQATGLVNKH